MTGAPVRVVEVLEATAGGTRRHLAEVMEALSGGEFRVHLVCATRRDPDFARDVERYRGEGRDVTVLPMASGLDPIGDTRSVLALRRLLQRTPCDVLHLHSAKAGAIGRVAARGVEVPVVYSPHAFPFLRTDRLRGLYERVERALAKQTDCLLAVSAAEGRLAVESGLYDEERVRVLPNALDVTAFDRECGELPPVRDAAEPRTFGLLGEARPQKDPLIFVEAARRVLASGVKARFALPAQGVLLPRVRGLLERHGIASHCELVPAEGSLVPLYRRIDVGVLPSRWEGLPYTMLEVLASRRPLLASRLPVFEDLLAPLDERLLFPPGDAAALAERMTLFSRLPATELEGLGGRGRAIVVRDHDAESWREGVRETLRRVARR